MMREPLSPIEARKWMSALLAAPNAEVEFTPHARQEMKNDGIAELTAIRVLRLGRIFEPAERRGRPETWRYRVHHQDLCVVVAFEEETRTIVVTAWRKR